jgi:hypothetical protein
VGARLTGRTALLPLAFFWIVAGSLLFASWRSAIAEDRVRRAPVCIDSQVFTSAMCQATLDGSVVGLSHYEVELDIGGRRFSMAVRIAADVSGAAGTPVRVTFYRGMPIRVDGPELKADVDGSFATTGVMFRYAGVFFLIAGPVLLAVNLLISRAMKPPKNLSGR